MIVLEYLEWLIEILKTTGDGCLLHLIFQLTEYIKLFSNRLINGIIRTSVYNVYNL